MDRVFGKDYTLVIMQAIKTQIKAVSGTLIAAIALLGIWFYLSRPLAKYDLPPERSLILNEMQKSGLLDFSIPDIDGKDIRLQDYKGKLVIVNFWASWCEPCIQEFPSLKKLIEKHSGDIVLLALSNDHNMEDLRTFLKAFDINSPFIRIAWDKDGELAKKYGVMALPESFLAGRDLKVIRKVSGSEDWFSQQAQAFFEDQLKAQ